jgi:predicted Holliday junction resolvase-like endonuclease
MTQKIVKQLMSVRGLRIECPRCNEEVPIKRVQLFGMYDAYPRAVQAIIRNRRKYAEEQRVEISERKKQLTADKKKRPDKISLAAQASTFGTISEQIVPAFLTFPYKQNECRTLFRPIDYVVFANLSSKGGVDAIKLVDVKTGGGSLTRGQKDVRDCVLEGRVNHKVIGE